MPKPTTGHVTHSPAPPARRPTVADNEQLAVDTLMTSVFSGIALIVATVVLGMVGGSLLMAGSGISGATGAKVGLGIGLTLGMVLIAVVLRTFSEQIKARSRNLYRGAWIGSIAALVIIVIMAYFPWIAIPVYCPPGAYCPAPGQG